MASPYIRRPLPTPPPVAGRILQDQGIHGLSNTHIPRPLVVQSEEPATTTLRGGTLLHQGFYDLISMIPTPSPLLFGWRPLVAGPRYEDISPVVVGIDTATPTISCPISPIILKKSKRISKDMVSRPSGFMCASYL